MLYDSSKNTILLISGGRGHGKDTFYNDLLCNNRRWIIYTENEIFDIKSLKNIQRLSFAKLLKESVWFDLTNNQLDEKIIDKYKNIKLIDLPNIKKDEYSNFLQMSFREYIIKIAMEKRAIDKDYWVKSAMKNYKNGNLAITDFRFENEYEYIKKNYDVNVLTIRVYRSNIQLSDDISESSLNNFKTDYLVLSKDEDFIDFISKFNQYKNYRKN